MRFSDFLVRAVGLLKHAEIDGKKLTWDIQVNSSAISVKLMWIKVEKPVEKTGQVTSQAQKNKPKLIFFHLSLRA
jgi:hypothetical protein